jgi:hypothetical protein
MATMPGSPGWFGSSGFDPWGRQAALRRMSQLDVAIQADTRWTSSDGLTTLTR